jgi:hypothetical protein
MMPSFTANKMEQYCENIIAELKDVATAEIAVQNAVKVVDAATGGNYDRDNIRTESFTESVIKEAQKAYDATSTTA